MSVERVQRKKRAEPNKYRFGSILVQIFGRFGLFIQLIRYTVNSVSLQGTVKFSFTVYIRMSTFPRRHHASKHIPCLKGKTSPCQYCIAIVHVCHIDCFKCFNSNILLHIHNVRRFSAPCLKYSMCSIISNTTQMSSTD